MSLFSGNRYFTRLLKPIVELVMRRSCDPPPAFLRQNAFPESFRGIPLQAGPSMPNTIELQCLVCSQPLVVHAFWRAWDVFGSQGPRCCGSMTSASQPCGPAGCHICRISRYAAGHMPLIRLIDLAWMVAGTAPWAGSWVGSCAGSWAARGTPATAWTYIESSPCLGCAPLGTRPNRCTAVSNRWDTPQTHLA